MSTTKTYRNWRLETDNDQILWVYFDKHNATVNTLNRDVMEEFTQIVDALTKDTQHKGVIIASGKKTGFIAGADISEFTQFKDIEAATSVLLYGQHIFDKLEGLHIPTVALIDGFCLGGGLELVLACRYRIAEESSKTRLGLPEVKLGIHPGWGGTVRLPRLIGSLPALNMILSGHTVSGKAAAKLGFVDAAVPQRQLVHAAKYYIKQQPPTHKPSFLQALANHKIARQLIGHFLRKKLNEKINPLHYPGPYDALNNWELVGIEGQAAYDREAKSCGRLFFSDTCQNLVRVFFLQEKLKGLAKDASFSPKHIHVIGAGTMGGDIAAWCAMQGMTVTLQDMEPRFIAPAIKRAYKLFKDRLKETYLVERAMDRLIPDLQGNGLLKADVVIEAVIEDLAVKQAIFKNIEAKAKPHAILATNTSSIPLDEINTVMKDPRRLVGIHFFNPVSKMMLVEVVKGNVTDQDVVNKAITFVRKIDKLPLPVSSKPGFLVNRILMPYLLESMNLMNEGVPATAIDKAMVEFGMPMGPITLADTVGLDVCYSVAKYLGNYYNTPVPPRLIELIEKKKLGKKTGEGFYKYDKKGKQIKPEHTPYDKPLKDIANRLVNCMLNESFACLREHVVASGDLLDAGMIFGTGFAPFLGGPVHYAKTHDLDIYKQYAAQNHVQNEKKTVLETFHEVK